MTDHRREALNSLSHIYTAEDLRGIGLATEATAHTLLAYNEQAERRGEAIITAINALTDRVAELEAQRPRIERRLGNVDALPPGSKIIDADGTPALKVADFDPGVTDGDGYHSEWVTAAGPAGTYDLVMPVRVLHIPTQEGQADA
ncbi:Uncharacterised protein [Mycobacteroides abscessus subsp. abscessus]|nr:Uncharacterised protein [Mycobacteroides abscessus subsp. abscessus]